MIAQTVINYIRGMDRSSVINSGANDSEINLLRASVKWLIPDDYLDLLRYANGFIGRLENERYVHFWSINDVLKRNVNLNVDEFCPGLLLIGSDGASVAYGIDLRYMVGRKIYQCLEKDFVSLFWNEPNWYASNSLLEFFNYLAAPDLDDE